MGIYSTNLMLKNLVALTESYEQIQLNAGKTIAAVSVQSVASTSKIDKTVVRQKNLTSCENLDKKSEFKVSKKRNSIHLAQQKEIIDYIDSENTGLKRSTP